MLARKRGNRRIDELQAVLTEERRRVIEIITDPAAPAMVAKMVQVKVFCLP